MSRITAIDGVAVTLFDGLPASASRCAVGIVGSGSSGAPSLIKRCAGRSGHQGPVLALLAMLAAKRRLRVAPRGWALPLTAAATGARRDCRPGRRNGAPTELRDMKAEVGTEGWSLRSNITIMQRPKSLIFQTFSGPSIILGWLSRSGKLCANIRGPSF